MRNVSSQRFRRTVALLSECDDLIQSLYGGQPTTALSEEEFEAAGTLAELCYSIIWTLCDNASVNMEEKLEPKKLMASLWHDDEHNPVTLMNTLWKPREAG